VKRCGFSQSVTQSSSVVSVAMLMCVNRLDKAVWMLISKEFEENTPQKIGVYLTLLLLLLLLLLLENY
jgi:hypothetical protein